MKKTITILEFIIIILFFTSCDSNRCDDGYSEVNNSDGSSYCIKNFESGIENKINEYGNTFYHQSYGIIKYVDQKWTNEFGETIFIIENE